jgi:hypothetical protein
MSTVDIWFMVGAVVVSTIALISSPWVRAMVVRSLFYPRTHDLIDSHGNVTTINKHK